MNSTQNTEEITLDSEDFKHSHSFQCDTQLLCAISKAPALIPFRIIPMTRDKTIQPEPQTYNADESLLGYVQNKHRQ